jgi:SAM-dependent methyltransferase
MSTRAARAYTDEHAAAEYWRYQEALGRIGGELNRWKFAEHVTDADVVLDFGCGGGYLLAGLPGAVKLGVEPNRNARAEAARKGIRMYARAADVESFTVDVVISQSALEHALSPYEELCELARALRPAGRLVISVPTNDPPIRSERQVSPDDPNHEFYAWSPQAFYNLLLEAGFEPQSVRRVTHAWHPRISPRLTRLPRPIYNLHAWLIGVVLRRREVFAVATKRS